MNAKRSLMAAIFGIATMIAMPLAANAGGHYADRYENNQWQAPAGVVQVGHHNGWRDSGQYNSGVVCDQDGDDCRPAVIAKILRHLGLSVELPVPAPARQPTWWSSGGSAA